MAQLNSKTAKHLRKVAGYRNASATPASPPFPGIHHLMEFPLSKKRIRTTPPFGETLQGRMVGNRRFIPVLAIEDYKFTDESGVVHTGKRHACQPVPVTKPAVHVHTTEKGMYKKLKRLYRAGILGAASAELIAAERNRDATQS